MDKLQLKSIILLERYNIVFEQFVTLVIAEIVIEVRGSNFLW